MNSQVFQGLWMKKAPLSNELNAKTNPRSSLHVVATTNYTYLAEIKPCPAVTITYFNSSPWKLHNFTMNSTTDYKTRDFQINSH
jgi:hypothetical protein